METRGGPLGDPGVVVLYNQPAAGPWPEAEAGILEEVRAVLDALAGLGRPARPAGIRSLAEAAAALDGPETLVFNLVESLPGDSGPAVNSIPALCRALGKGCTGNDSAGLALCLDKALAGQLLQAAGVPTPEAAAVPPGAPMPRALPAGPLLVKPSGTDASEGIDASALVPGPGPELEAAVARVHARGSTALVEHFVAGRELNAALLEQAGRVRVLPLAEIDFSAFPPGKARIVDYAAKWLPDSFEYRNTPRIIPAALPAAVAAEVQRLALAAWRALGCRDYARVDFRLDDSLRPFVLEVNPNPDIAPDAGFAAALEAGGVPYGEFVGAMVANARRRIPEPWIPPGKAHGAVRPAPGPPPAIAASRRAERDGIMALLEATGFFHPAEIAVAAEVLDEALAAGPACTYRSLTALIEGRPGGWVCFGPTPCTQGAFDVYWLAVDPRLQGRGVGRALMAAAEAEIQAAGGRLAVAETAGRPGYAPTRRFYGAVGYLEEARLADFYAPGDDKVVFVKRF